MSRPAGSSPPAPHGRGVVVEVCCGSLDDARTAAAAGVDRIELNSGLPLGGLTPSAGLVESVLATVRVPVIAMLRPRPGGFCYTPAEWETVRADLDWLLAAGAAGVAVGVLDDRARIDVGRCRELVGRAGQCAVVFHRAFDLVADWRRELEVLVDCGVRRVMTSGQAPTALAGADTIRAMVEQAGDRIAILPAGGITAENAGALLAATGVREIHGSFSAATIDPGYPPASGFRFAPNDGLRSVDAAALQRLFSGLGRTPGRD